MKRLTAAIALGILLPVAYVCSLAGREPPAVAPAALAPTVAPTIVPTEAPTVIPTAWPTPAPTTPPTRAPTRAPTALPRPTQDMAECFTPEVGAYTDWAVYATSAVADLVGSASYASGPADLVWPAAQAQTLYADARSQDPPMLFKPTHLALTQAMYYVWQGLEYGAAGDFESGIDALDDGIYSVEQANDLLDAVLNRCGVQ